jgi:hypothetical protein
MVIEELYMDLRDGRNLIALLERLSSEVLVCMLRLHSLQSSFGLVGSSLIELIWFLC